MGSRGQSGGAHGELNHIMEGQTGGVNQKNICSGKTPAQESF